MTGAPDDRPNTGGPDAGPTEDGAADRAAHRAADAGSMTARQLGGYVLIAALILALVRFLRGSRARRG